MNFLAIITLLILHLEVKKPCLIGRLDFKCTLFLIHFIVKSQEFLAFKKSLKVTFECNMEGRRGEGQKSAKKWHVSFEWTLYRDNFHWRQQFQL